MSQLLNLGDAVGKHARLTPNDIGARDLARSVTFRQWNERSCRLANALLGLGLVKGDRVAILAYNCLEWMELYVAMAKAGLVAVPVNFRLVGPEIRYIVEDAEARALVVQDNLVDRIEEVRSDLSIAPERFLHFGGAFAPPGYLSYEALIGSASASEPSVKVVPEDPWVFMYTSGTTGKPKGAIRTHHAGALLSSMIAIEQDVGRHDTALLVMPMCHANSLYFATAFAYRGATSCVYDRQGFDPEHLLATLSAEKVTFTSLVPTHYIRMLGLPESVKSTYDVSRVSKLLVSSAPARKDTKLAIMDYFGNSRLYEMYGSTEAGWVTCLRPDEQFTKLGSIGREVTGTARIKLLDRDGTEVPEGEVGELYSHTPFAFVGYWKLPEKTAEAFRGPYCSVGDLARRDDEGYYYLVDRKSNMIISGGENIYPSEVENVLGAHPKVKDVAVIGVPDDVWGESVRAVAVLHDGQGMREDELVDWCRPRIAGYKRPRSIAFIREEEMPRTATGKILHRVLRERYGTGLTTPSAQSRASGHAPLAEPEPLGRR
jgi:fatty-acyl-CoA synthase